MGKMYICFPEQLVLFLRIFFNCHFNGKECSHVNESVVTDIYSTLNKCNMYKESVLTSVQLTL